MADVIQLNLLRRPKSILQHYAEKGIYVGGSDLIFKTGFYMVNPTNYLVYNKSLVSIKGLLYVCQWGDFTVYYDAIIHSQELLPIFVLLNSEFKVVACVTPDSSDATPEFRKTFNKGKLRVLYELLSPMFTTSTFNIGVPAGVQEYIKLRNLLVFPLVRNVTMTTDYCLSSEIYVQDDTQVDSVASGYITRIYSRDYSVLGDSTGLPLDYQQFDYRYTSSQVFGKLMEVNFPGELYGPSSWTIAGIYSQLSRMLWKRLNYKWNWEYYASGYDHEMIGRYVTFDERRPETFSTFILYGKHDILAELMAPMSGIIGYTPFLITEHAIGALIFRTDESFYVLLRKGDDEFSDTRRIYRRRLSNEIDKILIKYGVVPVSIGYREMSLVRENPSTERDRGAII